MPTRRLPSRPDLEHLRHQARDLREARRIGSPGALQRIREFHPRFSGAQDAEIRSAAFTLADAYLTIAREYGFRSWARLQDVTASSGRSTVDLPHHERIEDEAFRQAVSLMDDGDVDGLREHLARHPGLTRRRVRFEGGNYFRDPTLLEFAAENPVRHGTLPPNITDLVRAILDADASPDQRALDSTLELVCSGRVPRECGVQLPLVDLLCDHGARPQAAMLAALVHGELEAAEALIRRGAPVDLVAAAALGRLEEARTGLAAADPLDRHRALALAAQHGHPAIVRLLLDAGESPNRYNPVPCHAHSTPLHQAALAGHEEIVRLLVERGARLDAEDLLFKGTPAGWAEHGGHRALAAFLRAREERP